MGRYGLLSFAIEGSIRVLKERGQDVDTGRWQGLPTGGKPDLITKELLGLSFEVPMARVFWDADDITPWLDILQDSIQPNLPWADEHFAERIGGVALNPDPSHERWPWWSEGAKSTTTFSNGEDYRFTHTYSERFWPQEAMLIEGQARYGKRPRGVRYQYGNLTDVLNMLLKDPKTRQAYIPIFFPEDTGAVHGGRIPCSLGYHVMLRNNHLHLWYDIRSCDAVRHFRDDVYLAIRLCGHIIQTLMEMEIRGGLAPMLWGNVKPGILYFSAHSFHVHRGDYHKL